MSELTLASFVGFLGLFLLVPFVIAFTQWVKRIRPSLTKPQRALVAMASAIFWCLYLGLVTGAPLLDQLFWGVAGGLAASGTYDLGKRYVVRAASPATPDGPSPPTGVRG